MDEKTTAKRVFLVCLESRNRAEPGADRRNALNVIVDFKKSKTFSFRFWQNNFGRAWMSLLAVRSEFDLPDSALIIDRQ